MGSLRSKLGWETGLRPVYEGPRHCKGPKAVPLTLEGPRPAPVRLGPVRGRGGRGRPRGPTRPAWGGRGGDLGTSETPSPGTWTCGLWRREAPGLRVTVDVSAKEERTACQTDPFLDLQQTPNPRPQEKQNKNKAKLVLLGGVGANKVSPTTFERNLVSQSFVSKGRSPRFTSNTLV